MIKHTDTCLAQPLEFMLSANGNCYFISVIITVSIPVLFLLLKLHLQFCSTPEASRQPGHAWTTARRLPNPYTQQLEPRSLEEQNQHPAAIE